VSEIETSEVEREAAIMERWALSIAPDSRKAIAGVGTMLRALATERGALAARLEQAEQMAEALMPFSVDYRDMWSEEQNDGYRTSDAALVCDGSSGITVGDLRTAVAALAAWHAAKEAPK
jgi:hypothetical protein